jgi:excinuclease ABC subunit C
MYENYPNDLVATKVKEAPTQPGIYQFLDENGKIIYIGKAKNIRNRVRSYFQKAEKIPVKTRILSRRLSDVEFIVTDSEVEALILENNLVKKHKPRYNVRLKDDKTYPYIRITNEPYPRIFVTRKIEQDGSQYIGPFTEALILRRVVRTLQNAFKIRTCRLHLTPENTAAKKYALCLDYHIGKCDGPCQNLISQAEYKNIIQRARRFLMGHTEEVILELTEAMTATAKQQAFEEAKELRDQIAMLQDYAGSTQKVEEVGDFNRDFVAMAHEDALAVVVVIVVRNGKVINRQDFQFSDVLHSDDNQIMQSFLEDYYLKQEDLPAEVMLSREVRELDELEAYLQARANGTRFITPQKGKKKKIISMAEKNARLQVEEMKLERLKTRMDYIPHNISALQRDLHMDKPPKRMECFDISNIQGTNPVASMVCFIDGKPKKSEYRIFKIQSKDTPDDFAMLAEATRRRYIRVRDEALDEPDLIVIDGGKGQLSSVLEVLNEIEMDHIPLISLAKRLEEVFLPGLSDAQNIPKTSSSIKLLQQIRDEAHRFAVTHHRKQRKKRTLTSELDQIPGIGKERRQQLLKHFGSVKKIKNSSKADLLQMPGLSDKLANAIYDFFHPNIN